MTTQIIDHTDGRKMKNIVSDLLSVKTVRWEHIGYTMINGKYSPVWMWTGGKKTVYQVGGNTSDTLTDIKPELA